MDNVLEHVEGGQICNLGVWPLNKEQRNKFKTICSWLYPGLHLSQLVQDFFHQFFLLQLLPIPGNPRKQLSCPRHKHSQAVPTQRLEKGWPLRQWHIPTLRTPEWPGFQSTHHFWSVHVKKEPTKHQPPENFQICRIWTMQIMLLLKFIFQWYCWWKPTESPSINSLDIFSGNICISRDWAGFLFHPQYSRIPIICHSSTSPYTFHSFWYWEAKWTQYLFVEGIFYIFALPKNNLSFTKHFFTQFYIQDPWLEKLGANRGPNSSSYIDENNPPRNKAIFEAPPLSLIGPCSILVGGNIGRGWGLDSHNASLPPAKILVESAQINYPKHLDIIRWRTLLASQGLEKARLATDIEDSKMLFVVYEPCELPCT